MARNSFGEIFRITTWGESHGKGYGVVIDGCPAGLEITEEEINRELFRRRPGNNQYTSPRKESDLAKIYSGVFEGKTTGAPLSIIVLNQDADSEKYTPIKDLLRPGHANYTYLAKYKIFDYRGGGRSSARETLCRVAAGAVAKKLLNAWQIAIVGYIAEVGHTALDASVDAMEISCLKKAVDRSAIFCPDEPAEKKIQAEIEQVQQLGDSIGGVVALKSSPLPVGLGEPVYGKIEASLARAMLSIPACKGFAMGSGFSSTKMRGSEHNDLFCCDDSGHITMQSNHAGGVLGGLTNGMPLKFSVAFKPTSSIAIAQQTVDFKGQDQTFVLPEGSRHDPCVALRAVPVVEAMTALVLVDCILLNLSATLDSIRLHPSHQIAQFASVDDLVSRK